MAQGTGGCELCTPDMVLIEDELAYVRYDNNSLSKGHVLAVPRRHVADFFDNCPSAYNPETHKLFVPLMGFNILYRFGGAEGQASASYLVGRGNEEDEKLAPFRIDQGPKIFRGLSSRAHSIGMQNA